MQFLRKGRGVKEAKKEKKKITGNSSRPQIIRSAGKYDSLFFRTRMLGKRQNITGEKNKAIIFRVVLGTCVRGDCFPNWWKKPTPARDWYQATCFWFHPPLNGKKKGLIYGTISKIESLLVLHTATDVEQACVLLWKKVSQYPQQVPYPRVGITSTSYFSGAIKCLPHNARTNAVTEEQHF